MSDNTDGLESRQIAMYRMFETVAERMGKWDKSTGPDGAHYVDKSPFASEGMVCSNCSFFQGGRQCEIVKGDIDPAAICKLWVIKGSLLKE